MAPRTWTCQRRANGEKCGHENFKRFQICQSCGKKRPATKKPAHRAVLEHPYSWWLEKFGVDCGACHGHGRKPIRGDQFSDDECPVCDGTGKVARCALCGRGPTERTGKLDRDHDHKTGEARGLLCFICNRALNRRVTSEWLRRAADYLEKPGVPPEV